MSVGKMHVQMYVLQYVTPSWKYLIWYSSNKPTKHSFYKHCHLKTTYCNHIARFRYGPLVKSASRRRILGYHNKFVCTDLQIHIRFGNATRTRDMNRYMYRAWTIWHFWADVHDYAPFALLTRDNFGLCIFECLTRWAAHPPRQGQHVLHVNATMKLIRTKRVLEWANGCGNFCRNIGCLIIAVDIICCWWWWAFHQPRKVIFYEFIVAWRFCLLHIMVYGAKDARAWIGAKLNVWNLKWSEENYVHV